MAKFAPIAATKRNNATFFMLFIVFLFFFRSDSRFLVPSAPPPLKNLKISGTFPPDVLLPSGYDFTFVRVEDFDSAKKISIAKGCNKTVKTLYPTADKLTTPNMCV